MNEVERICERCAGPNIVWFAPNEIWNACAGSYDILCPTCFVTLAELRGYDKNAWLLAPEFYGKSGEVSP